LVSVPLETVMPVLIRRPGGNADRDTTRRELHAQTIRVAAEKKQSWRRHWQDRAEVNSRECFFFVCIPWQTQRVLYEPPHNVNQ
jgi:hypothetical protein